MFRLIRVYVCVPAETALTVETPPKIHRIKGAGSHLAMSRNALLEKQQSWRKKILNSGFFSNYFIYTMRLFLFFFALFLCIFQSYPRLSTYYTLHSRPSTFSYTQSNPTSNIILFKYFPVKQIS